MNVISKVTLKAVLVTGGDDGVKLMINPDPKTANGVACTDATGDSYMRLEASNPPTRAYPATPSSMLNTIRAEFPPELPVILALMKAVPRAGRVKNEPKSPATGASL